MRDSTDFPSIDDPGMAGGGAPEPRTPGGDTADDTGGPGEPEASELTLPGPDDPVAWSYVEPGTEMFGSDGDLLGRVETMLGTETEGIFHGIAVDPAAGGQTRVVPADAVRSLTPSRVDVDLTADGLAGLEEHQPREAR